MDALRLKKHLQDMQKKRGAKPVMNRFTELEIIHGANEIRWSRRNFPAINQNVLAVFPDPFSAKHSHFAHNFSRNSIVCRHLQNISRSMIRQKKLRDVTKSLIKLRCKHRGCLIISDSFHKSFLFFSFWCFNYFFF